MAFTVVKKVKERDTRIHSAQCHQKLPLLSYCGKLNDRKWKKNYFYLECKLNLFHAFQQKAQTIPLTATLAQCSLSAMVKPYCSPSGV